MKDDDQEEVLFDVMRASSVTISNADILASVEFNKSLSASVVADEATKKAAADIVTKSAVLPKITSKMAEKEAA